MINSKIVSVQFKPFTIYSYLRKNRKSFSLDLMHRIWNDNYTFVPRFCKYLTVCFSICLLQFIYHLTDRDQHERRMPSSGNGLNMIHSVCLLICGTSCAVLHSLDYSGYMFSSLEDGTVHLSTERGSSVMHGVQRKSNECK